MKQLTGVVRGNREYQFCFMGRTVMENNNKYSFCFVKHITAKLFTFTLILVITACSSGGDDNGGNPQKPELVQTPRVIGSDEAAAVENLTELGLEVTINRVNQNAPIGEILEQVPPAGQEIEVGQLVTITVSDGISVPNLLGMTAGEASQTATDTNLTFSIVYSNNVAPIDEVISQSISNDTNVNPGTEIQLVVSSGIAVPNVIGMSRTDATTALTDVGFVVAENRINNNAFIDTVINQNHTTGTNLNFGSTIILTVSNGITVPDLTGQSLQNARSVLNNLGFIIVENRISDRAPIDNIINQSPAGNTNVNAGTAVTLVVSNGILVPNVVGMERTEATNVLLNLGFTVGENSIENSAPINDVFAQNPSGGTNQNYGSLINLNVSSGIVVPDVVGMSRINAIAEFANRGLGVNEIRMDNVAPIDTVFGQSLTGQYVNTGTIVDIGVSDGLIMPDVVGMNANEANILLRSMGFLVDITQVDDPMQIPDQVFEQDPASGTRTNGAITVALSVYVDSTTACLRDYTQLVSQIYLASASRGGRLYDNWWVEAGMTAPAVDHPLWDTRNQPGINTRYGADTWRCVECHGWDYKGADGVYGDTANNHYTGFPGVMAAQSKQAIDVFCAIHSGVGIDSNHNFSNELSQINILHLTKFLVTTGSDGLADSSTIINADGTTTGSSTAGQTLYEAQDGCSSANCHGINGTAQQVALGSISNTNPWQTLHKIRLGHPGSFMPGYADPENTVQFSLSQTADVIAYIQTLPDTTPLPPPPPFDLDIVARGGRLYDNWISETGATLPPTDNPTWALQTYTGGTNTRTGADTWRCTECHGWDYKGVNGVYGDTNNNHYTGFAGILNTEKTEQDIIAYLTSGFFHAPTATTVHNYESLLQPADIEALAKFIKLGTIDTSIYIGPSGIINGTVQNFQNGADLYRFQGFGVVNGNCELCHDTDGRGEPGVILGLVANENPWRTLHKVRFGQPNSIMPALINQLDSITNNAAFDVQDAVDITHYSQSLTQQ